MEQRITRAKAPRRRGRRAVRDAGRGRAAERLAAVAAMIYLLFNEGYSASGGSAACPRAALRGGDPAGAAAAAAVSRASPRSWG